MADVHAQIEELTALVADVVEMARRRAAARRGGGGQALRGRPRRGRPGAAPLATGLVPRGPGGVRRVGRARAAAPRRVQRARQRREVEPAGRRRRRLRPRRRDQRPRPRPGIDPDDLLHVFDRFYRSAAARTGPARGSVLAIVRQVAEAHGGTVCAERVSEDGGGTIVRICIPTKLELALSFFSGSRGTLTA